VVKLAVDSSKTLVGTLSAANFTGGGGAAVGNLQSGRKKGTWLNSLPN
jgi:hypothetical protein